MCCPGSPSSSRTRTQRRGCRSASGRRCTSGRWTSTRPTWQQLWKGTPAAKWVNDPKVVKLVENPSKRLAKAEVAARDLSAAGQKILNEKGLLRTDTAEARPNLPRKQAAEVLGREPKGITGEPYYVPHTLEPQSAPNVLTAGGGGKAVPRAPGATKQNLGHLFLNGKMHLRSDVLGTEFLRRVKYVKYDEIHNALTRGAIPVTRQQLEEHYGGQLPKGYEYMRAKPSDRIPATMRARVADQQPDRQADPEPDRPARLAARRGVHDHQPGAGCPAGRQVLHRPEVDGEGRDRRVHEDEPGCPDAGAEAVDVLADGCARAQAGVLHEQLRRQQHHVRRQDRRPGRSA